MPKSNDAVLQKALCTFGQDSIAPLKLAKRKMIRASTCHYTRARLLFKNMRPGVFTLNDSLTLEYVPTAQNKQFCAS